jgi:tetratricopeptide (TPR) repeat protein
MDFIWTFIWDNFLYPYFAFGKREIFIIPIVAILLWFLFIRNYKNMTKRDTVASRVFLIPSIVTVFISVILFYVLTNLPLTQPKDAFIVAITQFKPVSEGAKDESTILRHRLIESLKKSQEKLRINLKVLPLTDCILDTTKHKYDIADTLGRHYRAHIVIFGVVRIDNKEVLFKPIIYNRVKSKYLKPESIVIGKMLIDPDVSDREKIHFKERKVQELSDFVTFILGLSQFETGDYEKTIRIFKTIQNQGFETHYFSGASYLKLSKFKEAHESFNSAVKIDPDNDLAWSNKGVALGNLNRFEDAVTAFDKAIELNPDLAANNWSNKCTALHNLNRYDDAIEACDKAIELNHDHASAWSNKGSVLYKLSSFEDAVRAYDTAINLNPKNYRACSNKAAALLRLNRFNDAIKACDKAIAINPNFGSRLVE